MTSPSAHEALMYHPPGGVWLAFRRPVTVVSTEKTEEILPALREVENQVEQGGRAAVVCLAYEAAPAFDSALRVRPGGNFPLLWAAIYPGVEESDMPGTTPDGAGVTGWTPDVTDEEYYRAIRSIKEHIREGRTYQVNYTYRLGATFSGDPFRYFCELSRRQHGYSAYVDTGRHVICSVSPELFFEVEGDTIVSRPMKGTARRGRWLSEDREVMESLSRSEKDRAENVMIVDMVRNDLGRIARAGSVRVTDLCAVEKYRTVWQMTSNVEARTTSGLPEILQALFPPASITGAPKASTMGIIAALESTPRRIYTGTIGYLLPGRRMRFNVAIRTALLDRETGRAAYGVGGGIVWGSDERAELEEARLKARILSEKVPTFSLLETILWTPGEGYHHLGRHLARLELSSEYFDYPFDRGGVRKALDSASEEFGGAARRVRLLLSPEGRASIEPSIPHPPAAALTRVCLAPRPVSSTDTFLYHKTTNRGVYDRAREECTDYDDVILWNERGEITESTIANIALDFGDRILTPPVESGLLPGVYRSVLLDSGKIQEQVVTKNDLARSIRVLFMNSVRGMYEVQVAGRDVLSAGPDTATSPQGAHTSAPETETRHLTQTADRRF